MTWRSVVKNLLLCRILVHDTLVFVFCCSSSLRLWILSSGIRDRVFAQNLRVFGRDPFYLSSLLHIHKARCGAAPHVYLRSPWIREPWIRKYHDGPCARVDWNGRIGAKERPKREHVWAVASPQFISPVISFFLFCFPRTRILIRECQQPSSIFLFLIGRVSDTGILTTWCSFIQARDAVNFVLLLIVFITHYLIPFPVFYFFLRPFVSVAFWFFSDCWDFLLNESSKKSVIVVTILHS